MDDKAKKDFFNSIYKENCNGLVRVSYHITKNMEAAEDVCQEAFIKLYQRLDGFPTAEDAKYWLIKVVKNLSLNYLEHEKVKTRAFDRIKQEPAYTDDTGEKHLLKKETVEKINQAESQLPEILRVPYIMREHNGMNYKDIASALEISESNVKIRIHRARGELRKLLSIGDLYVS